MYVCMTNATAVYAWDHSLWQKDQKALRRSWRVGSCCHAHETIVWSQNETNTGEPTNAAGIKNMQQTRNSSNCSCGWHLHTLLPTLRQSSWHQRHALIVAPCDTRLSSVHDDDRIGTSTCSRQKEASYTLSSYSLNMVNQSFLYSSIKADILYIKCVMVTLQMAMQL